MFGQVITYAPAFINAIVNPNALFGGGLPNVNVVLLFTVLVKLLAVAKSKFTLPPVPKEACVSL